MVRVRLPRLRLRTLLATVAGIAAWLAVALVSPRAIVISHVLLMAALASLWLCGVLLRDLEGHGWRVTTGLRLSLFLLAASFLAVLGLILYVAVPGAAVAPNQFSKGRLTPSGPPYTGTPPRAGRSSW